MAGYGLMVFRSLRRHPARFLTVWLGVVALTALGLAVLPQTYDVQTTLQVARYTPTTTVVSRTARATWSADPDRRRHGAAAREPISLVRQTNLLNRWNLHRAIRT